MKEGREVCSYFIVCKVTAEPSGSEKLGRE
jgi:hypothetical protein